MILEAESLERGEGGGKRERERIYERRLSPLRLQVQRLYILPSLYLYLYPHLLKQLQCVARPAEIVPKSSQSATQHLIGYVLLEQRVPDVA